MQFIKQEDNTSPAFSVWSIGKTTDNLVPSTTQSGHILNYTFIVVLFQLLLPKFLSVAKLFEYKFYR